MPVSVNIEHPEDNIVELSSSFLQMGSGFVNVKGKGNRITIGSPMAVGSASFVVTGKSKIEISDSCLLGNVMMYAVSEGSSISVGSGTAFNGGSQITVHEPVGVKLGRNCLIAPETSFMASDVHKIYNEAGDRINFGQDIVVGDRVWIGARCAILRGAVIGNDCVVGWASVVKGKFPNNSLIVGAPARVKKAGITWKP